MENNLLLTRPDYEPVTHYLFAWSQKLIGFANKNNWNVFDLAKNKATLKNFENTVGKNQPGLILLHGHGNYSTITCQNEEILLEVGLNESLLKGTNTYAFSCQTGKALGKAAIKKGAKSYIGYDEDFVFLTTNGKNSNPLEDNRAGQFFEPALEISYSLLKNLSPQKAWKASQKAFKNNIDSLISSKSKEVYLVRYLLWNMNHQVCLTS